MHRLSRGERKVLNVYRKFMIMYGISQIHRVHSRLTTGLGGLKPIWILVPSTLGRYREVPVSGVLQMVSEHRAS